MQDPPSSWDGHLCSALEIPDCFLAALVSLLVLSTAVVTQNAAHRRERAVQPNTEELGALSHLFSPLWWQAVSSWVSEHLICGMLCSKIQGDVS